MSIGPGDTVLNWGQPTGDGNPGLDVPVLQISAQGPEALLAIAAIFGRNIETPLGQIPQTDPYLQEFNRLNAEHQQLVRAIVAESGGNTPPLPITDSPFTGLSDHTASLAATPPASRTTTQGEPISPFANGPDTSMDSKPNDRTRVQSILDRFKKKQVYVPSFVGALALVLFLYSGQNNGSPAETTVQGTESVENFEFPPTEIMSLTGPLTTVTEISTEHHYSSPNSPEDSVVDLDVFSATATFNDLTIECTAGKAKANLQKKGGINPLNRGEYTAIITLADIECAAYAKEGIQFGDGFGLNTDEASILEVMQESNPRATKKDLKAIIEKLNKQYDQSIGPIAGVGLKHYLTGEASNVIGFIKNEAGIKFGEQASNMGIDIKLKDIHVELNRNALDQIVSSLIEAVNKSAILGDFITDGIIGPITPEEDVTSPKSDQSLKWVAGE